jgi:Spy/CpxP family protein refolding chaperone
MHKLNKLTLIALAAAVSVPAALAQNPDPGPAPDPPPGPAMMYRQMARRAWRDDGGRGRGPGSAMGMSRWGLRDMMLTRVVRNSQMREQLGITADQATKIQQETLAFRKASIQDRANVEVKRVELAALLSAEQPDRAAIDSKLDEIGAARLAQEKAAIDFHLTMRNALTAEQRQKLEQMRENFRWRDGHMGGPRGMGGQRGMKRQQGQGPNGAPPPPPSDPDGN